MVHKTWVAPDPLSTFLTRAAWLNQPGSAGVQDANCDTSGRRRKEGLRIFQGTQGHGRDGRGLLYRSDAATVCAMLVLTAH